MNQQSKRSFGMHASPIDIQSFQPDHLDAAVELSRQAGWPHRKEDWALVLSISNGFVALENGRVVGTAMATLLGDGCATVNMVIVDEAMRGRGLGRRLMDAAIGATEKRECRLVATADGLPLYEKMGFVASGEVLQHQGVPVPGEKRRVSPGSRPSFQGSLRCLMRRRSVRTAPRSLQRLSRERVLPKSGRRASSRALQPCAPSGAVR
ncbi:acetyltransferase [Bradyrhizobium lupini HPC(L)]|uniref:Acetyltransferase n=1 Tax=Bradyrhizobium lupini HPC(L) TaxID=1229491 RepID=A0ABN0HMN2_RHILU|nr:acetyltransferase [Bradyrhizobium lupini HPC(L)]